MNFDRYKLIEKAYFQEIKNIEKLNLFESGEVFLNELFIFPEFDKRIYDDLNNFKILNERISDIKSIFINHLVYIIGQPGSGKTTLLKYLIINYKRFDIFEKITLPLFCNLIELTDYTKENYFFELVLRSFNKLINTTENEDIILDMLNRGECLLLLDGFDEIQKGDREKIFNDINAFYNRYNKGNYICITSRETFIPKGMEVFKILNPNEPQLLQFRKKLNQNKIEEFTMASKLKDSNYFTEAIFFDAIKKFNKANYKNKIDLFETYFSNNLISKGSSDTYPMLNDKTFAELSNFLYENKKHQLTKEDIITTLKASYKEFSEDTFLNEVDKLLNFSIQKGLLFEDNNGNFSFIHITFLEYFYTLYLVTNVKSFSELFSKIIVLENNIEAYKDIIYLLKEKDYQRYRGFIIYLLSKCEDELESYTVIKSNVYFGFVSSVIDYVNEDDLKKLYEKLCVRKITLSMGS